MAPVTVYLVDKSAWEWARRDAAARAELVELTDAGHTLAACHLTAMEMAFSARNADDHARILARQRAARWLPVTELVMDRALEIITMLAARGQHRTPIPDVLVAATAEHHSATVLHVDSDYDRIARLTGQPVHRLATASREPNR
jgi:predicted nucleic acid-binding protein